MDTNKFSVVKSAKQFINGNVTSSSSTHCNPYASTVTIRRSVDTRATPGD